MKRISALLLVPALVALAPNTTMASPYKSSDTQLDTTVRSIVVEPVSEFDVNVRLDRGVRNPYYRVGEPISITVSTTEDAYIYVFSIEADGQIKLISPNRFDGGQQFLRAGETRTFPPAGSRYRFTVSDPIGQAQVVTLGSVRPLDVEAINYLTQGGARYDTHSPQSLSKPGGVARSIVVEEVPQVRWELDRVYYRVGR